MFTLTLQNYISELLLVSAILFDLLFGSHIISKEYWRRPVLVKNTYRFYFIVLVLVLFGYVYIFFLPGGENIPVSYFPMAKLIVTVFAIIALVLSNAALKVQKISFPEFFFFYMVATLSTLLMLDANDLLFFYLLLEAQTLCFFVLATANRDNIFSNTSGLMYYLIGSYASVAFLLGSSLVYASTGTIEIYNLFSLITKQEMFTAPIGFVYSLGVILIISSLMFKIGAFPFHFWVPDVYEGAPLASTIVFSILPKFSLVYFLVKFVYCIGAPFIALIHHPLLAFGIFAVLVGSLFGIRQRRLKRLLVYSSIVQIGFVIIAISTNTLQSFITAFFFTIVYLLTASLLWGVLLLMYRYQKEQILDKEGMLESMTLDSISNFAFFGSMFTFLFIFIMFQVAGIPPLAGFYTKLAVLDTLVAYRYAIECIFLVFAGYISVYYYINLIKTAFFENAGDQKIRNFRSNLHAFLLTDSLVGVHIICISLLSVSILAAVYPRIIMTLAELVINTRFLMI